MKQTFAFQAEVHPSRISPGDPFILRVSDEKPIPVPEAAVNGVPLVFSKCGERCYLALYAAGLEMTPGLYFFSVRVGGDHQKVSFKVQPARFPVVELTLPDHQVFLNPADEERAEAEKILLQSLWRRRSEKKWTGIFIEPLTNGTGTAFGAIRIINKGKKSIHKGTDFRGAHGEIVRASNNGTVVLAQELFFGGKTIVIDHGHGIYTLYMHLSEYGVKMDDRIRKGEVIGFVGSSGRASGPHLHFGVKLFETDVNPLSFFRLPL